MGLDIGIMTYEKLGRPKRGPAYQFAVDEMCTHACAMGFMSGDSNSYGWFEKDEVLEMLDGFAERQSLTQDQKAEVWAWVESLPWDGDYIELHFNW